VSDAIMIALPTPAVTAALRSCLFNAAPPPSARPNVCALATVTVVRLLRIRK
jgi:hypothetical protein